MRKIYKFNHHWLEELKKHKDLLDNDTRILVTYIEILQQENKQLKEDLRVSQSNEETYELEMQEITKILGLDEHTLFDDVKDYAKQLKEEIEEYKRIEQKDLEAFNNYDSILTELEEYLNKITKKWCKY